MLLVALVNVALNLVPIPRWAVALISEWTLWVLLYLQVRREFRAGL